jgi:hypothetical protein
MGPVLNGVTIQQQQQPNGQGLDEQPLADNGLDEQGLDEQGLDEQQLDEQPLGTQVPVQTGQVQQGQDKECNGGQVSAAQKPSEQAQHDGQGGKDVKHGSTVLAPAEDAEVRRTRIKELFGELVDLLVR